MILVIDVGTTGLRAATVDADATLGTVEYRPFPPDSPFPGLVEFDAARMAELVLDAASSVLDAAGASSISGVGVAAQRASTIVWDRSTGQPVGPGLGWQDLRTVGACITAKAEHGLSLAPNQSATKLGWLLANVAAGRDTSELCFGTVDTWIAWTLSSGELHITDHTNAAVTGLYSIEDRNWDAGVCDVLGIDISMLPEIVDTSGIVGLASALPGAPPIAALCGDQQGSLVGQGCIRPGDAKITFGTGGMLDVCTGPQRPEVASRSVNGTFPIVAWSSGGELVWGVEGVMLSAGTNVEWLVEDIAIIDSPAASHEVAAQCETTDGVVYVPALLGLGTPEWDFGARGTLFGLTRGTKRPQVVRAVLEGVAHRGADMIDSAIADTGFGFSSLRIDGGMSRNPTFVQALANSTGATIEVSPVVEATTLGAAYLAGAATGVWTSLPEAVSTWSPSATVEPGARLDRDKWAQAISRAKSWIPELSALDF